MTQTRHSPRAPARRGHQRVPIPLILRFHRPQQRQNHHPLHSHHHRHGGQRQRIAIAQAMLQNAQIILLEATSSLDSQSEYLVQLAFDRLTSGRTTIVIAHRLSTVLHADKIAVLVNGKSVEEGRHVGLLALGNHYASLYHLQFEARSCAVNEEDEAPPTVPGA